jgi:hypothetical protein
MLSQNTTKKSVLHCFHYDDYSITSFALLLSYGTGFLRIVDGKKSFVTF